MRSLFLLTLTMIPLLSNGCTGWKMDYGKPAAHILAEDLRSKGKPYVGEMIALRGKVESVDISDPKSCWVILEGNIRCNYGEFLAATPEEKVGKIITVSGFLRELSDERVVINPAMGRDPLAPFNPLK